MIINSTPIKCDQVYLQLQFLMYVLMFFFLMLLIRFINNVTC